MSFEVAILILCGVSLLGNAPLVGSLLVVIGLHKLIVENRE